MISKHIAEPLTPPNQIRKEINDQISETIEIMMRKDPKQRIGVQELRSLLKSFLPNVDKPQPNRNDLTLKQRDASHQASESS